MIALLVACTPQDPPALAEPAPVETADSAPPAWPPPNDVLVLITDDQGTDKVGAYAEHPYAPPTPNIDALALRGRLFRNAYAFPVCSPTRAALLTGRMPRRTGVGQVLQTWMDTELPLSEVLLPELLATADRPWSTAAIGKWHLAGFGSRSGRDHPNIQGFDRFTGAMGNLYDTLIFGAPANYYDWEKVTDGVTSREARYATTVTVDDALDAIRTLPEPWFVYVSFNAPHEPLDPPPAALSPTFGAVAPDAPRILRYHAMVEALDTEIGRLLGSIDPQVLERTTVIFLSDNGTPGHAVLPPLEPKRAKNTLYEAGIRVPLIVAGPLVERPGVDTDALVQVVDLFATVAEIAGVPLGEDAPPALAGIPHDGRSLLPLLADPLAEWPREVVHSEAIGPVGPPPYEVDLRTSRDDTYKVIGSGITGFTAVYDVSDGLDDGEPLGPSVLEGKDQERIEALLAEHEAYWDTLVP